MLKSIEIAEKYQGQRQEKDSSTIKRLRKTEELERWNTHIIALKLEIEITQSKQHRIDRERLPKKSKDKTQETI